MCVLQTTGASWVRPSLRGWSPDCGASTEREGGGCSLQRLITTTITLTLIAPILHTIVLRGGQGSMTFPVGPMDNPRPPAEQRPAPEPGESSLAMGPHTPTPGPAAPPALAAPSPGLTPGAA